MSPPHGESWDLGIPRKHGGRGRTVMRQFVVLVYAGSTPVGHPASFGAFELALGFLILGEEAQTACEDALITAWSQAVASVPVPLRSADGSLKSRRGLPAGLEDFSAKDSGSYAVKVCTGRTWRCERHPARLNRCDAPGMDPFEQTHRSVPHCLRPPGVIGSRAAFKPQCLRACGFKSHGGYGCCRSP